MTDSVSEQAAGWSGVRPFVGRAEALSTLLNEVEVAASSVQRGGRAVFLLGPRGAGKSVLLSVFQEYAHRLHRDVKAEYVNCAYSGARTWTELAELLTRGRRLRSALGRAALEWLDAVPLIGDLAAALIRTVQAVRTGSVEKRKTPATRSPEESALAAVRLLLAHAPLQPRVIILDSLEQGDAEDLAGASAFLRRIGETNTLLVAGVRTTNKRPPEAIRDLILEGERMDRLKTVELSGLSANEVREAVARATDADVPDVWAAWLAAESRGVPARLWSLLGTLADRGNLRKSGRHWSWEGKPSQLATTASASDAGPWTDLVGEDRRLLAAAARQGPVFHSAALAQRTGRDELEIEDRLSELCRLGLIEYRGAPEIDGEVTSEYAFSDPEAARALGREGADGLEPGPGN